MAALFQQWLAEPLEQPRLAARFEIGWQPRYQTTIFFLALFINMSVVLLRHAQNPYLGMWDSKTRVSTNQKKLEKQTEKQTYKPT